MYAKSSPPELTARIARAMGDRISMEVIVSTKKTHLDQYLVTFQTKRESGVQING